MFNSDTAKERVITHPEAKKALTDWFAVLSEREATHGAKRVNGRAWRAELRRVELPYGAMMCEGYSALRRQLLTVMPLRPVDEMALALFASVAVHIKKHTSLAVQGKGAVSFAAQLGEKVKDKSFLSALRFERLQQATEPEVFAQQLIRAVRIRGNEGANVVSLADGIFLWMREWQNRLEYKMEPASPFERHRIRWAGEYISTAHSLFL